MQARPNRTEEPLPDAPEILKTSGKHVTVEKRQEPIVTGCMLHRKTQKCFPLYDAMLMVRLYD
jgi:hypothetical protein